VLPLDELLRAAARREVPARAIAVTFDDGYADTYRFAYPVLRRYALPATVYLAAGFIDGARGMWNDRLGVAIRDTTLGELRGVRDCLPERQSAPLPEPLPLATPAAREQTLAQLLGTLKPVPPTERDGLVDDIIARLGISAPAAPTMLTWTQVREMHAKGVAFGAHTVNHPILTAVPLADARREIAESKRLIEDRLQSPIAHFAYPNGTVRDFDERTKALVAEAGFTSASTMIFGTNTPDTDRYALRRGGPSEADTAVFAAKLWWYRRRQAASPAVSRPPSVHA
jgi:peptidoglycan/xylan/chitin deacetylase (PgdA/CDA1 family)